MHDAIKLDAGEAQTARPDADMHIDLGLQRVLVVCRGVACTSGEREQAVLASAVWGEAGQRGAYIGADYQLQLCLCGSKKPLHLRGCVVRSVFVASGDGVSL